MNGRPRVPARGPVVLVDPRTMSTTHSAPEKGTDRGDPFTATEPIARVDDATLASMADPDAMVEQGQLAFAVAHRVGVMTLTDRGSLPDDRRPRRRALLPARDRDGATGLHRAGDQTPPGRPRRPIRRRTHAPSGGELNGAPLSRSRPPTHHRRDGLSALPGLYGGRPMTPQLPWERDRDELLAEARAVAGPEDE